MRLAQDAGLHDAVADRRRGDAARADSIDDLDIARLGGMKSLFSSVYAPSTLGSFPRTFTHGHVRQSQAAAGDTPIGLAQRAPLFAGADDWPSWTSTRCCAGSTANRSRDRVRSRQGRWLQRLAPRLQPLDRHPLDTLTAPVVATTRLRSGNTGSARGAASMIAEAITTARACGATGENVVRADSELFTKTVIGVCFHKGSCRADHRGLSPGGPGMGIALASGLPSSRQIGRRWNFEPFLSSVGRVLDVVQDRGWPA